MKSLSKQELKEQLKKALNKGYGFDIVVNRYNLKVLIDDGRYTLYKAYRKNNPYIHLEKLFTYDDLKTINKVIDLISKKEGK